LPLRRPVVLAAPVSAQTPSPAPQAQAPTPAAQAPAPAAQAAQALRSPVEGDLVSVDTVGKKITIKPLTGADLSFTYNDKTEITGAQKDAAGLRDHERGACDRAFLRRCADEGEDSDTHHRGAEEVERRFRSQFRQAWRSKPPQCGLWAPRHVFDQQFHPGNIWATRFPNSRPA
jgi:hypothetical protein